jgi:hypothetical protein
MPRYVNKDVIKRTLEKSIVMTKEKLCPLTPKENVVKLRGNSDIIGLCVIKGICTAVQDTYFPFPIYQDKVSTSFRGAGNRKFFVSNN